MLHDDATVGEGRRGKETGIWFRMEENFSVRDPRGHDVCAAVMDALLRTSSDFFLFGDFGLQDSSSLRESGCYDQQPITW